MITDERRREVAQALRGLSEDDSFAAEALERDVYYDALVLRAIRASVGRGDIFSLLADLTDRPTCHDTGERINSFTCSSCGFREGKIMFNPFTYSFREIKPDWKYCPNCGDEVVEDD